MYGVVQHSGSLQGGHYVAYVKYVMDDYDFKTVKITEDRTEGADGGECGYSNTPKGDDLEPGTYEMKEVVELYGYQESGENDTKRVKPGNSSYQEHKWYCTNDSWVSVASEAEVYESQAYLLLYVKR